MPSIVLAAVMAIVSLLLGNPFHSLGFGMVAAVFMVGGMLFMCMGFLGISWVPLRRSTRTAAVDHQRAVRRNRWNIGYRGCYIRGIGANESGLYRRLGHAVLLRSRCRFIGAEKA
jgi:hypothetical protein